MAEDVSVTNAPEMARETAETNNVKNLAAHQDASLNILNLLMGNLIGQQQAAANDMMVSQRESHKVTTTAIGKLCEQIIHTNIAESGIDLPALISALKSPSMVPPVTPASVAVNTDLQMQLAQLIGLLTKQAET